MSIRYKMNINIDKRRKFQTKRFSESSFGKGRRFINNTCIKAKRLEEIFPDGMRWTALVLEYGQEVDDKKLAADTYELKDIDIKDVYASDVPRRGKRKNGRFVIIEPEPLPETMLLKYKILGKNGEHVERRAYIEEPKTAYRQKKEIYFTNDQAAPAFEEYIPVEESDRGYLDDFRSGRFEGLFYNFYIPEKMKKEKRYPLVLFLEGSGAMGEEVRNALFQGEGGCIWASPKLQEMAECFVLAPQFPGPVIVNDTYECREEVDKTERLLDFIVREYPVDDTRIYLTGQSMGCMAACELNIRRPDTYAASLFVAGQWDPIKMRQLKKKRIWIFVSEEDKKAFSGMNKVVEEMEKAGAQVGRYHWDARAGKERLEQLASEAAGEHTAVKYTVFTGDSVLRDTCEKTTLNLHQCTWWITYGLKAVRSWFLGIDM